MGHLAGAPPLAGLALISGSLDLGPGIQTQECYSWMHLQTLELLPAYLKHPIELKPTYVRYVLACLYFLYLILCVLFCDVFFFTQETGKVFFAVLGFKTFVFPFFYFKVFLTNLFTLFFSHFFVFRQRLIILSINDKLVPGSEFVLGTVLFVSTRCRKLCCVID